MGEVEIAGDETSFELRDANSAERRLALAKVGCLAYVQKVAQHVGAGIDVWIGGHRRNVSRVPASRLRACWREQLDERLASAYLTRRVVQLRVAQFPAPPAPEQCLGDAGIKTLGANGGKCVLSRLDACGHSRIVPPRRGPSFGSNFGSNLTERELI